MRYAVAVGAAALFALVRLWIRGTKLPARVIYDKPTTAWPIASVIFASILALAVAMICSVADVSEGRTIFAVSVTWYLSALIGREKSKTRLLYDRGGRAFTPMQMVTGIGFFFGLLFIFARMV